MWWPFWSRIVLIFRSPHSPFQVVRFDSSIMLLHRIASSFNCFELNSGLLSYLFDLVILFPKRRRLLSREILLRGLNLFVFSR